MTSNTVHPLMVPRFEVVLDYPNSDFYVGDIIEMDCKTDFFTGEDEWQTKVIRNKKGGSGIYCLTKFEPHPAIFKPLQWWEHRKPEEMPGYVKLVFNGKVGFVHKVECWKGENYVGQPLFEYYNKVNCLMTACVVDLEPATEAEYLSSRKDAVDPKVDYGRAL